MEEKCCSTLWKIKTFPFNSSINSEIYCKSFPCIVIFALLAEACKQVKEKSIHRSTSECDTDEGILSLWKWNKHFSHNVRSSQCSYILYSKKRQKCLQSTKVLAPLLNGKKNWKNVHNIQHPSLFYYRLAKIKRSLRSEREMWVECERRKKKISKVLLPLHILKLIHFNAIHEFRILSRNKIKMMKYNAQRICHPDDLQELFIRHFRIAFFSVFHWNKGKVESLNLCDYGDLMFGKFT